MGKAIGGFIFVCLGIFFFAVDRNQGLGVCGFIFLVIGIPMLLVGIISESKKSKQLDMIAQAQRVQPPPQAQEQKPAEIELPKEPHTTLGRQ
jgi:hypothetical protein